MTYEEREWGLTQLSNVWRVEPRDDDDMLSIVEEHRPDYLVAGMDWLRPDHLGYCGLSVDQVNKYEMALVYLPRSHNMSTSEILRRVRE